MTTPTYDKFRLGHRPAAFLPELKSHKDANSERHSPLATIAAFFRRLVDSVVRANQRKVLYRQLISLDDHMLADIGIHRGDIPRLAAESYRAYTETTEVQAAETRPDPLTIEEDLAVMDVLASDVEAPRAA